MATVNSRGVLYAVVAGLTFGSSGVLVKPLLLAGWSPGAAATVRTLVAAAILAPFALRALGGRWQPLRAAWRRVLLIGLIGSAGTQLAYYAAVERVPVSTAALVEFLSPVALVLWASARGRRLPHPVVAGGTCIAVVGLVQVIGPGALGHLDAVGLAFAFVAMAGCAVYYVVAADASDGLPPVVLAAAGLLVAGVAMTAAGALRVLPFDASAAPVRLGGADVPVAVVLLIIAVVPTAVAYAASVVATELLGSRLASFFGLLEVLAATVYAWLLLGEGLAWGQAFGGALILGGIALVRAEPTEEGELAPDALPDVLPDLVPDLVPDALMPSGRREHQDRATEAVVVGQ